MKLDPERGAEAKKREKRVKEIPDSSVHILVHGGHGAEVLMSLSACILLSAGLL